MCARARACVKERERGRERDLLKFQRFMLGQGDKYSFFSAKYEAPLAARRTTIDENYKAGPAVLVSQLKVCGDGMHCPCVLFFLAEDREPRLR